jgi:alpha-tubulin suppressor-like RCC1 family protein
MNDLRFNRKRPRQVQVWTIVCTTAWWLAACGGGGGDTGSKATSTPAPSSGAAPTAAMTGVAPGKTPWNIATNASFSLQQATGEVVNGALSCVSQAPGALQVTSDCAQVKGLRLGTYAVTVSGGGISAAATVRVIPPAQPLAIYNTSTLAPGTLTVTQDGRLMAWGGYTKRPNVPLNNAGLALPTQIANLKGGGFLTNVVAAAHGQDVTLALTEDGQVYSWGLTATMGRPYTEYLYAGEIYPGLVTTASGPLQGIVAVSTAANVAQALTQDGTVYVWGSHSTGVFPEPSYQVPELLTLPDKAVALSSGQNWAAILLANGRVMSLRRGGSDDYFNTSGRPTTPGAVGLNVGYVIDDRTGQPLEGIVQVAAGGSHGLALTRDGQVLAWGQNNLGQLGQGSSSSSFTRPAALPVRGPGGTGVLDGIVMVAAGYAHSLALDGSGRVYSWGFDLSGQLGDGPGMPRDASIVRCFLPELVLDVAGTTPLSGVRAVYAGTDTSAALMTDAHLLMWGARGLNDLAQGPGATTPQYQPLPLAVLNEAGTAPLSFAPLTYWSDLMRRGTP